VPPQIELSGISVVAAGAFNPAIFHPSWFAAKGLLPESAVLDAQENEFVWVRELATFSADWLSLQVSLEQASLATAEEGREADLRDLAINVFDILPETPVNAVGLNADAHFRVGSEEEWHAIGDRFLPKDFWEPLFQDDAWRKRDTGETVGLRSMTVEATRKEIPGHVRTEVAPSVRLEPHGVYVGVNAHFQLTSEEEPGNGYRVARVLDEHWDDTRSLERQLIERILEIS
jgi:hypothetical protein